MEQLYGREAEEQRIRALLEDARAGRSAALAVIGDAGEGKTALLERAAELAGESWKILRCTGVETEAELLFAGLQILLGSAAESLEAIERLPDAERVALSEAIHRRPTGGPVDRFLVGLATLSLLGELSDGPVLCLIDDAQWLDRASADALHFAARRLVAEGVVMLFAGRPGFEAPGIATSRLTPLDQDAGRRLLRDRMPDMELVVRERILHEAMGNPLALMELPHLAPDALPVGPLPLPERLRLTYERRIDELSAPVRTALLVIAAEETGDLALITAVLAGFGLGEDTLAEAERTRHVVVTDRSVCFRHPLQRAAAYHSASFVERRAAHAALAAALAGEPDRRAWQLAAAASGPDENVADALESAATRALERAGYSAASTAMARAALLTADPARRHARTALASEWAAEAGRTGRALCLAADVDPTLLAPPARAQHQLSLARIEYEHGSLRAARDLLLSAAAEVAEHDWTLAATMLAHATQVTFSMGDIAGFRAVRDRLAALAMPAGVRAELLGRLDSSLGLVEGDLTECVAALRASIEKYRSSPVDTSIFAIPTAVGQALMIGDLEDARDICARSVAEIRREGMIGRFVVYNVCLATAELMLGHICAAESAAGEAWRIAVDIGQPGRVAYAESLLALIAAIRGDGARCRELADRNLRAAPRDYNFLEVTHFEWALALHDLGAGEAGLALDRLEALYETPNRIRGHWIHLLRDLVEAAARTRQPERAARAIAEMRRWSAALGSPFAEAILLRSRALLDEDAEAFERALKIQAAERLWYDHARTALVYGEYLRRERRPREARAQLRRAVETFDRLGATPWAVRARAELRAAGEGSVSEGAEDQFAGLTTQERQVVRLAAAGSTNKEIAATLFLSPKTVSHHLYRAFRKLGVTSRVELARLASTDYVTESSEE